MASSTLPIDKIEDSPRELSTGFSRGAFIRSVLKPLASLRLTVVLLAMAIFLVFAGTLAQTQKDIWKVVHEIFRSYIAWIDLQAFFPKSFFPHMRPVPGTIPFPGGWLIGAAMAVNLFAAHAVRFTLQARGNRMWAGLATLAVGAALTWAVIAGGSAEGTTAGAFLTWERLWVLCKLSLIGLCLAGGWRYATLNPARKLERNSLLVGSIALAGFTVWLWIAGDAVALGDSSMRILWQLIQGGLAGLALLGGCWLLFEKRAGIVLLHSGIGLLMLSELLVGTSAVEAQMEITEGGVSNWVKDIRSVELAVIDKSDPSGTKVVAVPQSFLDSGARLLHHRTLPRWAIELMPLRLRKAVGCTGDEVFIRNPELPFDIRVVQYMQNSKIAGAAPEKDNPATDGLGKDLAMEEVPETAGTSTDDQDQTAVYLEFLQKQPEGHADKPQNRLGTYLLSLLQSHWRENQERSGLNASEMQAALMLNRKDKPAAAAFLTRVAEPVIVRVNKKPYEVILRHKRIYKPYTLLLSDVQHDTYPGTDIPRNYSSDIRVVDADKNVDRNVRIWMNNPMRFAGETFYQNKVLGDELTLEERTNLQVVANTGWMIPYVSCMIVAVGMLFQFGVTLGRFIKRRETDPVAPAGVAIPASLAGKFAAAARAAASKAGNARTTAATVPATQTGWLARWFPVLVVVFCAIIVFKQAVPVKESADGFNLYAAGQIPVFADARAKPLDTLARNTLQVISNKETFLGRLPPEILEERWGAIETRLKKKWPVLADRNFSSYAKNPEKLAGLPAIIEQAAGVSRAEAEDYVYRATSERQPAIRWLLDLASGSSNAEQHRIFRIENPDVLALFGLQAREGLVYSPIEMLPGEKSFSARVEEVVAKTKAGKADTLTTSDRKVMELNQRIQAYSRVQKAFEPFRSGIAGLTPELRKALRSHPEQLIEGLQEQRKSLFARGRPPLITPPVPEEQAATGSADWLPLSIASADNEILSTFLDLRKPDLAVAGWEGILKAYKQGKPEEFNVAVRRYRGLLAGMDLPTISQKKVDFETMLNSWSPAFQAWILYILGFVLAALAWLGWSRPFNRAAFWLTLFTFGLHTFYLVSRIYISGRPPVTNLYSSAVFIGWGCVLLCLMLEIFYKLGVGNIIANIAGFATLFISFKLSGDGDTMTVMQAVLDTQFWLATHVTCITLGYATTFLAGLLGLFYILCGVLTPRLTPPLAKDVSRMIYGTLCFAMYFSFVGTVLGGLWADDSWGRFWGWDPKENGALIIVLWNALILHSRWAGLVRERGMAMLAVVGNMVTSWSWFGVNELGIGLHSYGFTEGVLLTLGIFVMSQFAVIALAALPREMWRSQDGPRPADANA